MPGGVGRLFYDTFSCDDTEALLSSRSSSKFPSSFFFYLYPASIWLEGVMGGEGPSPVLSFFSSISSDRVVHKQPRKGQ